MFTNELSPILTTDFYKQSHRAMYPDRMEIIYSTATPRTSKISNINKVVVFGIQYVIQKCLIDFFNENFFKKNLHEIVYLYRQTISNTLGDKNPDIDHIVDLHNLGYLPLKINALEEGTLCNIRTPFLTIENTDPKFFWLTNFVETMLSCELWQIMTSATIAFEYKKLLTKFANETSDILDFVEFQGHDFSMRGMSSLESSISSGMGHLTSFVGTDTIPAIKGMEYYYPTIQKTLIGTSIPATEHSIQCTYENDLLYFKTMLDKYPNGFLSIVSDGYDYWNVLTSVLPQLKNRIIERDGKIVIRPDSGDPVKIICGDPESNNEIERKGSIEVLYDLFGGNVNSKGYKQLDPHIGLIYGDSITLDRCKEICQKLKDKGFASTNLVFGIGSFTYQYNTRDTFGFAFKTTACKINGNEKFIFKDPKTDNGVKKSQKGRVVVLPDGSYKDGFSEKEVYDYKEQNQLKQIYYNGELNIISEISNIRRNLNNLLI